MYIQPNGQNDETVSNHSDQVHTQENHKDEFLLLNLVGETQKDEFRDGGLVSLIHISLNLKKKKHKLFIPSKTNKTKQNKTKQNKTKQQPLNIIFLQQFCWWLIFDAEGEMPSMLRRRATY